MSFRPGGDKKFTESTEGTFSRAEVAVSGLIMLAALVFGTSMYYVLPDTTSNLTAGAMREQFIALVTFTGNPVASVCAYATIAFLAGLIALYNRLHDCRLVRDATGSK